MKTKSYIHAFIPGVVLAVAITCLSNIHASEPKPSQPAKADGDKKVQRDRPRRIGRLRRPGEHVKNHREVRSAFSSVVSQPRKSTVMVYAGDKKVSLGTIIDSEGYILTKASELGDKLQCQIVNGQRHDARIVGIHNGTDLAMLKIEAKELIGIQWQEGDAPLVGSFLATPGFSNIPEAIGVVSVGPRKIDAPSGILGIMLEQDEKGPRIDQVLPDSGAEKAGLRVNDIVVRVNGKETKTREELIGTVRRFKEGDQVRLAVLRGEETKELTATLGSRLAMTEEGRRGNFQNTLGGPLSKRRAGFSLAIQHDTVLRPSDCGGPLVNLDGKAIGINIARSGRVSSLALPVSVIKPLIDELKSGKHAPALSSASETGDSTGSVAKKESQNDNATAGQAKPDNQ